MHSLFKRLRSPRVFSALSATVFLLAGTVANGQLMTTRDDFEAPGTQPLSLTDLIATPDTCEPCHSDYGSPEVEPFRNWAGSMMAQSGRRGSSNTDGCALSAATASRIHRTPSAPASTRAMPIAIWARRRVPGAQW